MKICVLGLDSAAPQILFRDERLTNIRRLMDVGVYGLVESIVPPDAIPAWTCFSASQDPGSLGVYGRRQRSGYSWGGVTPLDALTIDRLLTQQGKRSVMIGDRARTTGSFVFPIELEAPIAELMGSYSTDVSNSRTHSQTSLHEEILAMSGKHWQIAKHLLAEQQWDYFRFVDIGLDRLQHTFWQDFDPGHSRFNPGNPYEQVIPDYYRWLDGEIGEVFNLLDDETIVLVVSAYGAQRLDGTIAINEWLVREGLLVLDEYPSSPTPFENLKVNWNKTRAWSEGGYCAPIFLNLQNREPQGVIPPAQLEGSANEMTGLLEAFEGEDGQTIQTLVFRPPQIYREVRGSAPDLIAQFGGLFWRAVGSVGHERLLLPETGLDGCNHSAFGTFILAAPNSPLSGEYHGARLLDLAPTLLDLAGYRIPQTMQGKSLVAGVERKSAATSGHQDSEDLLSDRLAGLGYI